jgi:hypothetical protein
LSIKRQPNKALHSDAVDHRAGELAR